MVMNRAHRALAAMYKAGYSCWSVSKMKSDKKTGELNITYTGEVWKDKKKKHYTTKPCKSYDTCCLAMLRIVKKLEDKNE